MVKLNCTAVKPRSGPSTGPSSRMLYSREGCSCTTPLTAWLTTWLPGTTCRRLVSLQVHQPDCFVVVRSQSQQWLPSADMQQKPAERIIMPGQQPGRQKMDLQRNAICDGCIEAVGQHNRVVHETIARCGTIHLHTPRASYGV